MKNKATKIIIGVLVAAIVVVGGLLVVKNLMPAPEEAPGAAEAGNVSELTMSDTTDPSGVNEIHSGIPDPVE